MAVGHSRGGRVPVHVNMVNCYYDDVSVEQVLMEELPSDINDGGAIMLAAGHFSETDANNATTLSEGNNGNHLMSAARRLLLVCERGPPGI